MGIGWIEMLLILAVALVLFGPNLLRIARTVGQSAHRARDTMSAGARRLREIVRKMERGDL